MRVIDLPADPAGHAAPITHVAFGAGGRRLASSSYDGTVIVWDLGDPANPVPGARLRHRRLVNAAAWHPADPELLATASADKTAGIWRVPAEGPAELVMVLARHTDDVNSVAWLPDGDRLACVSEDGRATLWHARTGALIGEIAAHTAHCMMVAVSRDGLIATVGEDGRVAVTDPDRGRPVTRAFPSSIEGCAWSPSGRILAVARDDGSVDLLTPELDRVLTVAVSESAARTVAWADDVTFVAGAYDGWLHVLDVTGKRIRRMRAPRLWPRSVATTGRLVAAGGFGATPHVFDVATGAELSRPPRPTHGPNALAVLGGELLIGCDSGSVLAVGLGTGDTRELRLGESPILSLTTHGGSMYAGTYGGQVISSRGRADVGAPVPALCATDHGVVAGTYNGDLIALGGHPFGIRDTGPPHAGSVKSLAAVPGGFLSASTDRTVATGTLHDRAPLWEHGNLVNAVATLGGTIVATASRDHTVKVARRDRPGPIQTLLGPGESVKCVALLGDPDCPTVLAGSYDFGLYAWRIDWDDSAAALRSGRLIAEFGQGLSCMAPIGDGSVAVAGWDGRILVLDRGLQTTHEFAVPELLRRAGQAVAA